MVEWLRGLITKLTCTILLYPWKRHFAALSSTCKSCQALLNFSNISIKLKKQIKISTRYWKQVRVIASHIALHCFPASQEDKNGDEMKYIVLER